MNTLQIICKEALSLPSFLNPKCRYTIVCNANSEEPRCVARYPGEALAKLLAKLESLGFSVKQVFRTTWRADKMENGTHLIVAVILNSKGDVEAECSVLSGSYTSLSLG